MASSSGSTSAITTFSLRVVLVGSEDRILESVSDQGHRVFGARTVEQAAWLVREVAADLAVLHLRPWSSANWARQVRMLRDASPRCPVVVVVEEPTLELAVSLMREGARDLLPTPIDGHALRDAIVRLRDSGAWSDPAVPVASNVHPGALAREEAAFAVLHRLTSRQAEVLHLLLQGRANKEIAAELSIALRTLEDHVSGLLRKTGTADVRSLLALYRSHTSGLLATPGNPRVGVPDIARSTVAESSFACETQDASAWDRSVR